MAGLKFQTRPNADDYFMMIAQVVSTRGTCVRRRVGCVLINEHKHIIATGYNGPAEGEPHCYEMPCPGSELPSGTGLDSCEAIHAEANALLQCKDVRDIHTAYCTASPCTSCVKMLMNTNCRRIVFLQPYPHSQSRELWIRSGGEWVQHEWGLEENMQKNPLYTITSLCL